jgi:hypothetical protein
MSDRRNRSVPLPASEFLAKHQHEIKESEEIIGEKLLDSLFPGGMISLRDVITPGPTRDAWWQARASEPAYRLMKELRQYWLVRLLKAAKDENSPEAYRELLEGWLIRLGVEPPEGVLVRSRRPRGAPRKKSTEEIYRIWVANGQPEWSVLAFYVYRADYTRADARQRKKLRDRCARAVRRYQAMLRDENHSN